MFLNIFSPLPTTNSNNFEPNTPRKNRVYQVKREHFQNVLGVRSKVDNRWSRGVVKQCQPHPTKRTAAILPLSNSPGHPAEFLQRALIGFEQVGRYFLGNKRAATLRGT